MSGLIFEKHCRSHMLQIILGCVPGERPHLCEWPGAASVGYRERFANDCWVKWVSPLFLNTNHTISVNHPWGWAKKNKLYSGGESKFLLSRCFDPGMERGEREGEPGGERRGGGDTAWWQESSCPPLPFQLPLSDWSWQSVWVAWHGQEQLSFPLGHAFASLCYCPLLGRYSSGMQIVHRAFFSLWKSLDLCRNSRWHQGTPVRCCHEIYFHFYNWSNFITT